MRTAAEKRKKIALDKYSEGGTSIGKCAELAGLSVWEFLDLMQERGVPLNLSAKEILAQARVG